MSRKIEALLRTISDMQHFDNCDDNTRNGIVTSSCDEELSESELDFVVAAAAIPLFFDNEKKDP